MEEDTETESDDRDLDSDSGDDVPIALRLGLTEPIVQEEEADDIVIVD